MTLLTQTRHKECLSDLELDELRLGAATEDAARRAAGHIRGCARCRARSEELALFHQEWMHRELSSLRLVASRTRAALPDAQAAFAVADRRAGAVLIPFPGRRGRAQALTSVCSALLAAACVLLFVRLDPDEEVARTKGASALRVFAARAGSVVELGDHDVLRPGDRLRFAVAGPGGYAAVIGRDGRGNASVYAPHDDRFAALAADGTLAGAVEIDDAAGQEELVAIVCEEAWSTKALLLEVAAHGASAVMPSGCRAHVRTFPKEVRP